MKVRFLCFLFLFIIFGQNLFAQNNLEKIILNFELNGEPTIKEVGFDNSRNSWKVKYTLRIIDEEIFNKNLVPLEKLKFDTKYKKQELLIARGSFQKKHLMSEENRGFSTDIIFNDKIRKLLLSEKKYNFLLRVQTRVKTNFSKKKLKYATVFPINSDNENLLLTKTIGVQITVEKPSDGGFGISIFRK